MPQNRVFWRKRKKIYITIKFSTFKSVLVANFTLKSNFDFWTKVDQNLYFRTKIEKINIAIEFTIFEIIYLPHPRINRQFWSFWSQFAPPATHSNIFSTKQKSEHHHQIQHNNFQPILAILIV